MPPKGRGKSKLPIPLPEGMIMKDTEGNLWKLGNIIGRGGFGLIYLAFSVDIPVEDDAVHVIKVEYHENGPLFSELKFYQRAAKQEHIKKWMNQRNLGFLGIPVFWGSGLAEYNGKRYRFMVMERLGKDLQRILDGNGHQFKKETVLQLGAQMLDALEYIHEKEYVHGDIKAANLLLGYTNPRKVYLADYGLSYRYCPDGNHKQYMENPRKGHNGTIEFTSLDAHKGVGEIAKFLAHVYDLTYEEKPNYQVLKKILVDGLESSGICYDGPLEFSTAGYALNLRASQDLEVDLPKPPPKYNLPKPLPQCNCLRKAGIRVTQRQLQEQDKPAGLNKMHQHNEALLESTIRQHHRHDPQRTFSDVKKEHHRNRMTYSPVSLQETNSDFNSYVYNMFKLAFTELCQYSMAIFLLLILIFFSLYFL